ncbi:MAG: ABC transporter ATP-binding protein [Dehalococcoidia bacterium]|nr:ABC transporter ATP-binding protein [Dehalococcoidia bacterium]
MFKLQLDNVSLGYDKQTVLRNISFEARPGEMLGIIGPNGSGKSTLIKGITRLIQPSRGKIFLNGSDVSGINRRELAQLVAVVPQNPTLPEPFTGLEVVLMGRTPHLGLLRYEGKKDLAIVKSSMEATHTLAFAERRVGELSGGERQRLTIARALAQEPKIILMDEPTANLDINYQIETLDLVRRLCRKKKLIVVLTLHDLNLASQYCDSLVALSNGTIYCQGIPQAVINAQTIKDVYGAEVYVYPHPVNKLPATLIISDKDR